MEIGPLGLHPHEVPLWREFVGTASLDNSVRTTELSCRTANGGLLPAEIVATAIEIEGRKRVILTVRDNATRKKCDGRSRRAKNGIAAW